MEVLQILVWTSLTGEADDLFPSPSPQTHSACGLWVSVWHVCSGVKNSPGPGFVVLMQGAVVDEQYSIYCSVLCMLVSDKLRHSLN